MCKLPIALTASLGGPTEFPPNASPGTGFATVSYDTVGQALTISATFAGLVGTTTVAHIHCCTATTLTGHIGVAVTPGTLPTSTSTAACSPVARSGASSPPYHCLPGPGCWHRPSQSSRP